MEETKRRLFIIHAVLEGEVDVQETEPQHTWDFEWSATSQALPEGMTVQSYSFEEDALFVDRPNLDFDHIGDAEIEIQCKFYSDIVAPNNPSLTLKHAAKDGTKIYPANGNIMTNISGSNASTGFSSGDYHVINLKGENGSYTLTIDGTEVTGTGVTNNNYLGHVGINSSSAGDSIFGMYVKYIKWRSL